MSRKESQRRRDEAAQRQEAELRADLARLQEETADCYDSDCCCHRDEWKQLSAVRALLGKDPTV